MSDERTPHCDHKFVDSKHCLKCGWVPPDERTPVYHVWQTWPVRVPTCSLCGVRQTDTNADRECSYRPTHDPRTPAQIADAMTDTRTQCPNCGADGGGHFMPPSFGEEGFYMCKADTRTPEKTCPSPFESYTKLEDLKHITSVAQLREALDHWLKRGKQDDDKEGMVSAYLAAGGTR